MIERNNRNRCELCVTCSDQSSRNERNTPLGGVTVVTLVNGLVPMVGNLCRRKTVDVLFLFLSRGTPNG